MLAIVDYEMGNLRSVQKGFERVGMAAQITSDPREIGEASHVVLPGVGAFADAILALHQRQLLGPIKDSIARGVPFLGICLGLQLLFEESFEDGTHEGLGILRGRVVKFALPKPWKVPHMGWNQVNQRQESPLFDAIADGSHFYFVHSYYVVPDDESVVATSTDYGAGELPGAEANGGEFCSSVRQGNLFATQFHPEKSQSQGLQLLRNFAAIGATK